MLTNLQHVACQCMCGWVYYGRDFRFSFVYNITSLWSATSLG